VQSSLAALTGNQRLRERVAEVFSTAKDTYPLTVAALLVESGNRAAALELLKQTKPPTLLDEVVGLVLQLTITVSDPDTTPEADAQSFREWWPSAIPRIRELIKMAAPPWERIHTYGQIMSVLAIAREIAPERIQALTFLCDKYKNETEGEEAVRGFHAVELQMQKLTPQAEASVE
jgi:hypothetical protein